MSNKKFNAWNIETNTMHHDITNSDNWSFSFLNQDIFIWLQFTGLIDKNKKDIYEGDILSHETHNTKSVMKWVGKFICFAAETIDDIVTEEYNFYQKIDEKNLTVIGNIYENPELIQKQNNV